jgi:hypothetical protein
MYQVTFFKSASDPFLFAVTPDESGSVLPSPGSWRRCFSQMVHPQHATPESELNKLERGFKRDGYYLYPRNK